MKRETKSTAGCLVRLGGAHVFPTIDFRLALDPGCNRRAARKASEA
jgi:hypothetical protein